jgi:hypothetical protein
LLLLVVVVRAVVVMLEVVEEQVVLELELDYLYRQALIQFKSVVAEQVEH